MSLKCLGILTMSLLLFACGGTPEETSINGMTPQEAIDQFSCKENYDNEEYNYFTVSFKSMKKYEIELDIYFIPKSQRFTYIYTIYQSTSRGMQVVDTKSQTDSWTNVAGVFKLPGLGKATYLEYNDNPALKVTIENSDLTRYFISYQNLERIGMITQTRKSSDHERFCK